MNAQTIIEKQKAGQPLTEEEKAFMAAQEGTSTIPANETTPNAEGGLLQQAADAQNKANATGLQDITNKAVADKKAEEKMRVEKALEGKEAKPNGTVLETAVDAIEKSRDTGLNDAVSEATGIDKSEIENVALDGDKNGFQLGNKSTAENLKAADEEAKPEKGDTEEEKEAKKQYKFERKSIWQAYLDGDIDANTRNYFMIDAIAKFASNMGKSIGNIGAQYSGGSIDNSKETSEWQNIQNELGTEQTQMAKEQMGGAASRKAESEELANQAARIRNEYTPEQLQLQMESLKNQLVAQGININLASSKQQTLDWVQKNMPDGVLKAYTVSLLAQSGVDSPAQIMSSIAGLIPGV